MSSFDSSPAPASTGTEPSSPDLRGNDSAGVPETAKGGKHEGARLSYFDSAFAPESATSVSLAELLGGIKDGRWSENVRTVRDAFATGGKAAGDEAKKKLPAVTISGSIQGARKNAAEEYRMTASGLLQVDIDAKHNEGVTAEDLKRACMSVPHCLAVFESPSGTGVKAILLIEPSLKKHAASFSAAKKLFAVLGITIDEAVKEPSRLMFVSHDPEIWINPETPTVLPPHEAESTESDRRQTKGTSSEKVRELLSFIPKRPPYPEWFQISAAVFESVGLQGGLPLLMEWSPEEKEGEYANLYREKWTGKKVGIGTLVHLAKQHGYETLLKIPDDVVPLPGGGVGHHESSIAIFKLAAPTNRLFIRGSTVVEIVKDLYGGALIESMTPERLVEFVEKLGKRVAKREGGNSPSGGGQAAKGAKKAKWRTNTMPVNAAKIALQSEAARNHLPRLRQIVNSPIIVANSDGDCDLLLEGYHPHGGGVYVTGSIQLEEPPGDYKVAVMVLERLLNDFSFTTPADKSRAVASLISPALKLGGILSCDFPLDVAEADQSQSGKTYRQKLVAALYNEVPSVITSRKGGVGCVDESVANALLSGRPIIAMDNIRGDINSPLLETALRGHGHAQCRGFRASDGVDLRPFIFQLSTNGAEFTRDLANRSIITRIRKQPAGYRFTEYSQGNLLAHVAERRCLYLACVFSVVREWVRRGKPQTDESRHDFSEWTRSLDWIVRNLFHLPPLMDGHREEQLRSASPQLQWLREIILAAKEPHHFNRGLSASDLLDIAEAAGIEFPGGPMHEKELTRAGRILGRLFSEAGGDILTVDGYSVSRSTLPACAQNGHKPQKLYFISKI